MARYVGARRSGNDEHALHGVRQGRQRDLAAPARAPADPAAARMGRARSAGDRRAHRRGDRARDAQRQPHRRPISPPSASPTSARPRSSGTRRPAIPGTTPSSGRTRAPIGSSTRCRRRRGRLIRSRTGLPPATYFSGAKIQWILDNVPGVREAAARGEAVFGNPDTWVIWNLTGGTRRRRPRDRRHQREPDDADESGDARVGRRAARDLQHSARDAAGDPGRRPIGGVRRHPARRPGRRRGAGRPATSAISRRRPSARSASVPAKRRTPTAPATSCCSTPARRSCRRRPGC